MYTEEGFSHYDCTNKIKITITCLSMKQRTSKIVVGFVSRNKMK